MGSKHLLGVPMALNGKLLRQGLVSSQVRLGGLESTKKVQDEVQKVQKLQRKAREGENNREIIAEGKEEEGL